MGTDFDCGCRCSRGHWFPCKRHENDLIELIMRRQYIAKIAEVKEVRNVLTKKLIKPKVDVATLKDIPIDELDLDYKED